MRRITMVAMLALTAGGAVEASKVKVWRQHQPSQFDKAKLDGVVVTSEGALKLGRKVRLLADLGTTHVWDAVEDALGNIVAATGDEGKVVRIAPDGKISTLYVAADSQVLSLALGSDGSVYAGIGPGGKIVRIPPAGAAAVIAEGLGTYVWALAYDPAEKALYAGTGPQGKIYRLAGPGKAEVFYDTRQDHVVCLATGPGGKLFAGTDKKGLVFRVDGKDRAFVLQQAAQSEIRSLLAAGDVVYAGSGVPTAGRNFSSPDRPTNPFGGGSNLPGKEGGPTSSGGSSDKQPTAQGSAPGPAAPGKVKGSPSAEGPPPSVGENSVYRIGGDGSVREVFREKALMLGLAPAGNRLLVATGLAGRLYELDPATRESCELVRLTHGPIHRVIRKRAGGYVLAVGDPAKLYVLEDGTVERGTVLSEVLDAKIPSRWGSLTWSGRGKATVAVRSGNVAVPDPTWSAWSAEQTDPENARALAPGARFLQYRLTLQGGAQGPEVSQVVVRYQTLNQAPEITSLEVPDLDAADLSSPRKLRLKWNAIDPNEDELVFAVHFRKEGWKDWVLLAEDLEKKEFEWDPTTVPAGTYQVRITASDRRDNAPAETLTAQRVSAPLPIAQEAPKVQLQPVAFDKGHAVVEAALSDPLVRLVEAHYAVDGKDWIPVFPTDGLFDSRREGLRFRLENVRTGTHVIVVRVKNAAGIIGSADAVFRVP